MADLIVCRVDVVSPGSWMDHGWQQSCGIGRNGESEHLCVASVQGALRLVPRTTKMQGPGLEEGRRHVFNVRSCGGLSGGRPLMGRAPSVASYARGRYFRDPFSTSSRNFHVYAFSGTMASHLVKHAASVGKSKGTLEALALLEQAILMDGENRFGKVRSGLVRTSVLRYASYVP